jgi:putative oxidoreductase
VTKTRLHLVDIGLLVLRVGLGAMMVFHGVPKLLGGPAKWEKLGSAMAYVGIDLWPTVWGFAAAVSEAVGGVLLAIGLLTRLNATLLLVTMVVAAAMHLGKGDGIGGASHAIEDGIAFLALLLAGGGRYTVDAWIRARR